VADISRYKSIHIHISRNHSRGKLDNLLTAGKIEQGKEIERERDRQKERGREKGRKLRKESMNKI
jgi:hypothetical protein